MDDEERAFAYWPFIEKYLPDVSSRDDVLHSDIFTRYLDGDRGQTWLSLTANQERVSRRKINYLQFGAKREIIDSEFTTC